jgi:hypothetical protein
MVGGQMARPQGFGGHATHSSWSGSGSGWNRPGPTWGFGHRDGDWHGGDHFHHFGRTRIVYFLPLYSQPQYVVTEAPAAYSEPAYDTQADYLPMPAYPPSAPEATAAPPAPTETVQYATSGQPPLAIPAGARVTQGSVYKYTKDGVLTYTNIPPPNSAQAKLLFAYTEVVSSKATHTLYRCVGDKPGQVGYADKPVANRDCKSIQYDDASAN